MFGKRNGTTVILEPEAPKAAAPEAVKPAPEAPKPAAKAALPNIDTHQAAAPEAPVSTMTPATIIRSFRDRRNEVGSSFTGEGLL